MGIKILSDSVMEVFAAKKWQKTGIRISKDEKVVVSRQSGTWSINPNERYCDANGISVIGKEGYTLKGAREGALIGKVGSAIFCIGNNGETPQGAEGELELCANDDMDGKYGKGFADNTGSIVFRLETWLI